MAIHDGSVLTVVGKNGITELKPLRSWTKTDGVSTTRRFAGPADSIEAYFNELSAATSPGADEMAEQYQGAKGELLIKIYDDSGSSTGGNTEALNSVWELIANDLLKPIEYHTDFTSISAARKRSLEYAAQTAGWKAADGTAIAVPSTDAEKSLYGHYANQTLDFMLSTFILRKTVTVSDRSTITASYSNMNEVVTLASINPPSALIGALTSLPKMDGTSGAWEWLKKAPQVRQTTKTKYQIIYEYWGMEQWSILYTNGTWNPVYA